ncbi:MAG: repeat-containing protein YrrB [Planctomycetota bacterium]|jgi:hypothetical protein
MLGHGWVNWDDPHHVLANPLLNPVTFRNLAALWMQPVEKLFIPVGYTLFALEAALGRVLVGGSPTSVPPAALFHGVSLALHTACTVLVARLLRTIVSDRFAVMCGAALFAVHPLQVESVAWISEQRGLLAAVLSLVVLERYRSLTLRPTGGPGFVPAYLWTTAVFGAALLSKPSAAMLPGLLFCFDAVAPGRPQRPWRTSLGLLAPWACLSLLVTVGTARLQEERRGPSIDAVDRVILAGDALEFYAAAVVWPAEPCIDYGLTPAVMLEQYAALPRAALMWSLVAFGLLWPCFPEQRLAILAGIVPLTPVLGFVPFVFQDISTVADRYMYLAMVGPALALAALLGRRPSPWLRRAVGAALAAAAIVSIVSTGHWHDALSLNLQAVQLNGGTVTTLNNLGMALLESDRPADAAVCLRRAVDLDATRPPTLLNLALALHGAGQADEAESFYRRALVLQPEYAKAYNNLGILLAQAGRLGEARDAFDAALRADPTLTDARRNRDQADGLLRRTRAAPP